MQDEDSEQQFAVNISVSEMHSSSLLSSRLVIDIVCYWVRFHVSLLSDRSSRELVLSIAQYGLGFVGILFVMLYPRQSYSSSSRLPLQFVSSFGACTEFLGFSVLKESCGSGNHL